MLRSEYAKLMISARRDQGIRSYAVRSVSKQGRHKAASNVFKYHVWVVLANSPFLYLNWASYYNCYLECACKRGLKLWLSVTGNSNTREFLKKLTP